MSFTSCHIKPQLFTCKKKSLLLINSINLGLPSLEILRRVIQTNNTTSFITLFEKKGLTNRKKKKKYPVCMLLLQLSSTNIFIPCDK